MFHLEMGSGFVKERNISKSNTFFVIDSVIQIFQRNKKPIDFLLVSGHQFRERKKYFKRVQKFLERSCHTNFSENLKTD